MYEKAVISNFNWQDPIFGRALSEVHVAPLVLTPGQGVVPKGAIVTKAGVVVSGAAAPYGIVALDTDTTAGAATTTVYLSGSFNEEQLSTGSGVTVDALIDALRALNIYVEAGVAS
jgi:hypothetical protein